MHSTPILQINKADSIHIVSDGKPDCATRSGAPHLPEHDHKECSTKSEIQTQLCHISYKPERLEIDINDKHNFPDHMVFNIILRVSNIGKLAKETVIMQAKTTEKSGTHTNVFTNKINCAT